MGQALGPGALTTIELSFENIEVTNVFINLSFVEKVEATLLMKQTDGEVVASFELSHKGAQY